MKRFNSTSGFTLIEIIIVVVILGILAAIALPKVTENIDKARAAEAFNIGGEVGKAFDRCLTDQTGGAATADATMVGNCKTFAALNMTDPTAASASFTYTMGTATAVLNFTATGKFNGNAATDTINFTYDGVAGGSGKLCGPAGKFKSMCKS